MIDRVKYRFDISWKTKLNINWLSIVTNKLTTLINISGELELDIH